MSLFGKKKQSNSSSAKRVVFTSKRVRGIWLMESHLTPPVRRVKGDPSVLVAENRGVRTLH